MPYKPCRAFVQSRAKTTTKRVVFGKERIPAPLFCYHLGVLVQNIQQLLGVPEQGTQHQIAAIGQTPQHGMRGEEHIAVGMFGGDLGQQLVQPLQQFGGIVTNL